MNPSLQLIAPFSGLLLPLSQVPDPVFAGLMMGDGLAIEPLSSTLLAPCDGVISQLARTHHALTLTAANGAQILLHIGIDTVQLAGAGFTALVAQGDRVRQGQALIEVDLDVVARRAASLISMLVIANGEHYQLDERASGLAQAGQTPLLRLHALPAATTAYASELTGESHGRATVRHAGGLHARPAALVQNAARPFAAQVQVAFKGHSVNAKSMVALMTLGVAEEDDVEVLAQGSDAAAAAAAVIAALQTRSQGAHATAQPVARPTVAAGMLSGVCAAPGLAIAPVLRLDIREPEPVQWADDPGQEARWLQQALQQLRGRIGQSVNDALRRGAQAQSEIFSAHLALLDDPELLQACQKGIASGLSAGFAFRQAISTQCQLLAALGNPLLAERIADLRDLQRQLLQILLGEESQPPVLSVPVILVAEDLAPSQLASLPQDKVAGMLTAAGGATSHVAILARALGIPALVACGPAALQLHTGQQVLLDASQGWCHPAPDERTLSEAAGRIAALVQRRQHMQACANAAAVTLDGVSIEVAVNVANADEARDGLRHGADSVGLTRTEFLFIDRQQAPDAAEQQQAYQAVLDAMPERPVIIRTLDVGGDKEVPYLQLPAETNPALGLRGIRSGFADPALLDMQLNALLAVQPLSRLRILLPMISEVDELLRVRQRLELLAGQLGLSERPQLGVMIEVPAAALLADQLARHADFLSIGTNDLTQYTLAMDRCNATLASRMDALHPALLRLIAMTVEGARQHGKWVGVCGALASDPLAVPVLVGLGVTELSVSPGLVPEIKSRIRALDLAVCQREARSMQTLSSASEVRQRAQHCWPAA
ncbi:phosphoenolpyruvate--protein phosphotransferase [Aquitalea aquatica]|uniref:phosphoenolpyruvate--protein phosphotransferase n=1 Tax=Aquitalea aquatica TaxID=3044273 RepID=A0A838Y0F7_9NEIS|nr:phosphoenolpyruvate--protein phosphotransferase [Aquitalea magnusonii]MBA4707378.1 phosphoenolpyruvate--protein phosphotransferase [Aquitalea magnusonii]